VVEVAGREWCFAGVCRWTFTTQAQHVAATYVVSLGNMTVFDGIARLIGSSDTDYATVTAIGPNGTVSSTAGPVPLGKGDQHNWQMDQQPLTTQPFVVFLALPTY
jgi:hypothetical protein